MEGLASFRQSSSKSFTLTFARGNAYTHLHAERPDTLACTHSLTSHTSTQIRAQVLLNRCNRIWAVNCWRGAFCRLVLNSQTKSSAASSKDQGLRRFRAVGLSGKKHAISRAFSLWCAADDRAQGIQPGAWFLLMYLPVSRPIFGGCSYIYLFLFPFLLFRQTLGDTHSTGEIV